MVNLKEEIRSIIKYSSFQGKYLSQIKSELNKTFGAETPSLSTIEKWTFRFRRGETSVEDKSRSGRPKTGQNERNIAKVSKFLDKDRRLSVRELVQKTKLAYGTVYRIITFCLGLVIRCARWVPKILTPLQKSTRKNACKENIWLNNLDPDFFQSQIVAGYETYVHHFEPETKRQSMQWLPIGSQAPIKAIKKLSKKKVMALMFWYHTEFFLVKYF